MPRPEQPHSPESYRSAIPVTALAFSPDGATLASSGYHEVLLWNVADGTLLRRIGNMAERIYDLEFHPDGQRLAIAAGTPGQFGEVRIVSATDGSLVRNLTVIEDVAFGATFSPDGTRLACAGGDRAIRIFDVETGAEQVVIEDHADWVMAVAFSPDGSKLASASRDKTAKLFDAATGDALQTFNEHGDVVYGVGFLPDGSQVATCGADDRLRTWTTEKAEKKEQFRGFGGDVFQLQVLSDGQVVSCSEDKTARLHTLADGKEVRKFAGHNEWVYAVAAHAGTKRVATGSYDGEVRLWNLEDGAQVLTFRAAPGIEQVSK
jgi:WD40 repeat protein